METSQNVEMLAEALAKAQAELSPVPFDSNNPFYSSSCQKSQRLKS